MNNAAMIQIREYLEYFPSEAARLDPLLRHAESNSDQSLYSRKINSGHITSSGIIVSNDSLLVINHPALGKWLQPGGHIEPGETPIAAAQREVHEETGVSTSIHPWHQTNNFPIDIDVHKVPANVKKSESSHFHFDFRYLLVGSVNSTQGEHSSAWIGFSELQEFNLLLLVAKIKDLGIFS
jgi:8-oxo-dGTP pyrophosphatase MutT (NUDIX family)